MKEDLDSMKSILNKLQQLQMDDNFQHGIEIEATSYRDDGERFINAKFRSNTMKDDDGDPSFVCVLFRERFHRRVNDAEFGKFKYLLLSDVNEVETKQETNDC